MRFLAVMLWCSVISYDFPLSRLFYGSFFMRQNTDAVTGDLLKLAEDSP
jgi:hypothetical protein